MQSPLRKVNHTSLSKPPGALSPHDPSSYSRPELAVVTHISLCWNVDFKNQVISGKATLNFYVLENIDELVLDINCLKINSVLTNVGTQLKFEILGGPASEDRRNLTLGSKLTVKLPKKAKSGDKLKICIKYATDPVASALTWVQPAQTTGKKHPFLFSQCSPIHARSILPCQDTPNVRFTYDAEVTAPEELTVLMGALKGTVKGKRSKFHQPVPIPSHVFAIAVGALESRKVGPRSTVWAEKEDVERCAAEFSETEKYLQHAEKLCGPYDWTVYDILVLPAAFPHAAMENPCLTFVSPTLVVGDKSLTNVVIHEIMHSWTGNAVSIKNYEHFWLNEAFAVFLQRKVSASLIDDPVKAKRMRDLESLLGLLELHETIHVLGDDNPFTKIVLNLDGVHPADAFSRIPYEKGSMFVRYLEGLFGGPKIFDKFIRAYVRQFSMRSLDTDQFKAFVIKHFKKNDKIKKVDWETWFYGTGMPPETPVYDTTYTKPVLTLADNMEAVNYTFSYDDVKDFNVNQIFYLLQLLIAKTPMPLEKLRSLGSQYDLDQSPNKDIMYRWLRLCVRSRDESKLGEIFTFMNSLGRLIYLRPLYRDLYNWEEVRGDTLRNFLENTKYMSHVTVYNLRKDLHLND